MKKIMPLLGAALLAISFNVAYAKVPSSHTAIAVAPSTLDINTASANDLEKVSGIGPKKAAAIVAYRQAHGAFKNVNDLTLVHGIGKNRLARWLKQEPRLVVKASHQE